MPTLIVNDGGTARAIPFSPGESAREILEGAGIGVRVGCRGNGACGLCLVEVEAGQATSPTKNERLTVPAEQLAQNIRLACQFLPENDLQLRILNPASKSKWHNLAPDSLPGTPSTLPPWEGISATGVAYGLAIDLGTTQISVSLWDLKRGRRLQCRVGPNPQSPYGSDIVSRLIAAGESPENAQWLTRLPLESIAEALQQMCIYPGMQMSGPMGTPQDVVQVALVGNTAMLALLTGADSRQLLQPHNSTRLVEYKVEQLQSWQVQSWLDLLGIHPQARVEIISPLAGFIGSDLLAGVVATNLIEQPGSLLIDFGTNSEMALWDGQTLWVTSAAGGPAFESCGMQCGMPAETGAIYRFGEMQDSSELHFQVLGGGKAKGICGSGLVDLIARLRDGGELTSTGSFRNPRHKDGYVVDQKNSAVRLTKKDVDTFQRAKAAIGTGISTLLDRAQMSAAELSRVCVCGVFGQNLNVRNAQRIGLLPDASPERVELCGNTALAGCERLLLSPERTAELVSLRNRAAFINLSLASDFDTLFLENLYLEPLKMEKR